MPCIAEWVSRGPLEIKAKKGPRGFFFNCLIQHNSGILGREVRFHVKSESAVLMFLHRPSKAWSIQRSNSRQVCLSKCGLRESDPAACVDRKC